MILYAPAALQTTSDNLPYRAVTSSCWGNDRPPCFLSREAAQRYIDGMRYKLGVGIMELELKEEPTGVIP